MKMWIVLFVFFLYIFTSIVEARSGCCSHHGGVCGCSCCDGSPLSSTCAPYYPQCSRTYQPKVVKTYLTSTPRPILPTATKRLLPISTIVPTSPPTTEIKNTPSHEPTQPFTPSIEPTSNTTVLGSSEKKIDDGTFGGGIILGILLSSIGLGGYKFISKLKNGKA